MVSAAGADFSLRGSSARFPRTASSASRFSPWMCLIRWRSLTMIWSRTKSRSCSVAARSRSPIRWRRTRPDRPPRAASRDLLEVGVDIDGVEDAEIFLADLVAAPGRPADHLVVEDAAVHPPDKDEVGDGGHIDAGGQQIDGDDVFGVGIVLERLDPVQRAVDRAGDFSTRSCGCGPYSSPSAARSSSTRISA